MTATNEMHKIQKFLEFFNFSFDRSLFLRRLFWEDSGKLLKLSFANAWFKLFKLDFINVKFKELANH